jgi:hypothetical protein
MRSGERAGNQRAASNTSVSDKVWYAYHRTYAFKWYATEKKLLKIVPEFYLLSDKP